MPRKPSKKQIAGAVRAKKAAKAMPKTKSSTPKKILAARAEKRKADMAKPGKQGTAARAAEKRKTAAKARAKKKYK